LVAHFGGLAVFSYISRPHFFQTFQVFFQTREIAIDVLCPARIPNIGVHHGISSFAMNFFAKIFKLNGAIRLG
jgi:hypothetical protein